ncbi:MAG: MCP four helix bundle domain-containing protein [Deltaproteobacteria bacterium]|nr:MCP four helix bundle domain-containing protein [Deltaproteobacteria bacterium]
MKKIFTTLSISNKLAAVFTLLLFMMGVGGLVGLYNAGQLANVTERLYTDSFKRGKTLSSVENEFLSARQEMFLHAIINDNASKSYLEVSIGEHKKKIDRLLADYRKMGIARGQNKVYSDLREDLAKYWEIHGHVEEISREGRRDEALSLIRMEGNKSFTDAINGLKTLIKAETDTAYTAYQESDFFAGVIIAVTIAFTILAIITAGGLWLALTRSIVRPIIAIEDSAKRIAEGDLKQRVPVVTDDEIGSLAVEFNKMAESLENYYATLEKKVDERTDELKIANEELVGKKQELELANMELQEANKMKSQFLANVSHELRTPLNSIIGFSELLQEKAFGELNERQLQYVEYVHSSGGHLLQLINNILDLSRIEAGRMQLEPEDFAITETLGEVLGIVRPLAHRKNITIDSKTVPASPKLHADKAKFKQVMLNLLSNAVKFNVEGGGVTVDWDIVEEPSGMNMERFIVFRIKDTGIGIREEDRGKLFKEFEQIDSSITREYGGTGLGLVLTKRLVALHNGEIWFESEPGKGSVFSVKLPQGTEEIDVPVYSSRIFAPSGAEKLPLVLIGSESQDINHLLEIYLDGGSYEVFTAADGVDLLRKAQEQKPFAIIMGVTLPKKDGWEALKELKANTETAGIPVILISSIDNKELGYALGAVEYMEKPINRERLLSVLARLLRREREKKQIRVLLADGDRGFADESASFLEKEGFSVLRAAPGEEAVASVHKNVPDIAIFRIDGNKDELGYITRLREFAASKKTHVIVFTGHELTAREKKLLGHDIKAVLQKEDHGVYNEALLKEIRLAELARNVGRV